jgi:hypothetical protein
MTRLFVPLLFLCTGIAAPAATAEEGFIEGFPDVPILDVVTGIDGDSLLFDTPSGTVAEVTLLIEGDALNAMKQYRESLTALGWVCNAPSLAMDCWRAENRLLFKHPGGEHATGALILRLEPTG